VRQVVSKALAEKRVNWCPLGLQVQNSLSFRKKAWGKNDWELPAAGAFFFLIIKCQEALCM